MWFGDKSNHNISAKLHGRQTINRAELTAIILTIRKVETWPDEVQHLFVYSDSRLCVDGLNKWISAWKLCGWTRDGRKLMNADLWKLLDRILSALRLKLQVTIKHVDAHVGIRGNERADALAKAAARRALAAAIRTPEEQIERDIEGMAEAIVAVICR